MIKGSIEKPFTEIINLKVDETKKHTKLLSEQKVYDSVVILKKYRYVQYINRGRKVFSESNKYQLVKIQDQAS